MEDACGAPCLFLLSPCGDTGPREGFVGDAPPSSRCYPPGCSLNTTPRSSTATAVADSNGRRLGVVAAGTAVESLLPAGTQLEYDAPIISGATLGHLRSELSRAKLDPPADDPVIRATQPQSAHRPADQAGTNHQPTSRPATIRPPARLARRPSLRRPHRHPQRHRTTRAGRPPPPPPWTDPLVDRRPLPPRRPLRSPERVKIRLPGRRTFISVLTDDTPAYVLPRQSTERACTFSFPGPDASEACLQRGSFAICHLDRPIP